VGASYNGGYFAARCADLFNEIRTGINELEFEWLDLSTKQVWWLFFISSKTMKGELYPSRSGRKTLLRNENAELHAS
jgi:hypothetical protein